MADYDISKMDARSVFNQIIGGTSQVDTSQNVVSITPQNLDRLEALLQKQGIGVTSAPDASDAERLAAIMGGLQQSGMQISQTTQADGTAVYAISLTPESSVRAPAVATDQIQAAAMSETSTGDQGVSAALAGTPASPSANFENPYLQVGSAALLKQIFEALFAKKREIQQLVGDTGIEQVKMLIANTQAKVGAIDQEFAAKNLRESAEISYSTTVMATTGMAAVAGTIAGNKQIYHNMRSKDTESTTANSTSNSAASRSATSGGSSLTLSEEGGSATSRSTAASRAEHEAKAKSSGLTQDNIKAMGTIGESFGRMMKAGTDIAANSQEARAMQAQAQIDLNQQLIDRNLKATEQQKQDLNADGGKLLDMIQQFSKASLDITRNTFGRA